MLGPIERALLAILLLVLMTGMGATLTPNSFRNVLRAPRGVLIGLASQFGWMPLIAFGLAQALSLPPEVAISLIVVGCTPGGTTSNMFTYYARADLALSISMTVVSTLLAVVAMPLLLWLYATPFTDANLSIPYGNIVTTLALVLVPVGLGMLLRQRRPNLARRAEQLGSASGAIVLVLLVGSSLVRNAGEFGRVSPEALTAAILLGVIGMALGYASARGLGLPKGSRRAVALETGIQNTPLAFAIVLGSFPEALQVQMMRLPLSYGLFVLLSASVATWLWRNRDRAGARASAQLAEVRETA